jgi:hypothetical protein
VDRVTTRRGHQLHESVLHEPLGHRDVGTTMIDAHVFHPGPVGVWSPADRMCL